MKNSKETYIHGNVLINIRPILDSLEKILLFNYATFTQVYIYENYGSNKENTVHITTKIS